jgi:DNA polymerase III alpha subunit (gram-positive type)
MLDDDQIYVIVDIEADGPVPGLYSMLSMGAVATTRDQEVSSFYRKLTPNKAATQDPDIMDWWKTQPTAWKEVTTDAEPPDVVMKDFCQWLHELDGSPVFVAQPIAFDYTFVSWYLYKFANNNPFVGEKNAMRSMDLQSFISGKFGFTLGDSYRRKLPASLIEGMPPHSHKAIDDARGFGVILRNALKVHTS